MVSPPDTSTNIDGSLQRQKYLDGPASQASSVFLLPSFCAAGIFVKFLCTQNHRRITQDPVPLERLLSRRLRCKAGMIRHAGLCLCQPEAHPPAVVGS